jgi:hypothetical protein
VRSRMRRPVAVAVPVARTLSLAVLREKERHGGRLGAVAMPSGPVVQCTHRLSTLPSESNVRSIWWADAMGQPNAVR